MHGCGPRGHATVLVCFTPLHTLPVPATHYVLHPDGCHNCLAPFPKARVLVLVAVLYLSLSNLIMPLTRTYAFLDVLQADTNHIPSSISLPIQQGDVQGTVTLSSIVGPASNSMSRLPSPPSTIKQFARPVKHLTIQSVASAVHVRVIHQPSLFVTSSRRSLFPVHSTRSKAKASLYRKALKSYLKRTSEGREFLRQIKERRAVLLAAGMEGQQEQDGGSIVLENMQTGCVAGASFPGIKEMENAAFDF